MGLTPGTNFIIVAERAAKRGITTTNRNQRHVDRRRRAGAWHGVVTNNVDGFSRVPGLTVVPH